jgi:tetratricopeptide (TPR) repeat protein
VQGKSALVTVALCGTLAALAEKAAGEAASTNCVINVGGSVSGAPMTNQCGIVQEYVTLVIQVVIQNVPNGDSGQGHQQLQSLREELGLNDGQLRAALTTLGEKNVPAEQRPARLVEIAYQYPALQALLAELGDTSGLAHKAGAALSAGEPADAGKAVDQLIAGQEAEAKQHQVALAKSYATRAQLFIVDLNYPSAWEYYQKALQYQPDDPVLLNRAGLLAYRWGRDEDASPLFERAIAHSLPDSPDRADALNNLAGLYQKQGKNTEAEGLYKQGIAIGDKIFGPDNPSQAIRLNNLGSLYRRMHRYAEAEQLYLRAIAIGEKTLGPNDPQQAARFNNLGELYLGWGHFDDAEAPLQRSIDMYTTGPDNSNLIAPLSNLGQLRWAKHQYVEAEALYKRAIAIGEKAGGQRPDLAKTRINYAQLLEKQGRDQEAAQQRALAGPTLQ